ncbi:MAG: hypothetical protein J6S14_13365, partial [Clostridia bacterium]|nr:hypothetical protein [Clostridia bacterium]
IPASLSEISFSSGPIIEAIMQQHYDTEKGAWSSLAVKDGFRYAERVFPLSAKQLKEIRVTQGNPNYWDENGILFASQHLNGYIGTRTYPTHQLIKLPSQHMGNGDGTYRIPDGTDYIHSTAIYQCANLHTVYIPDSVTLIAPAAIIATAENPLTLICTAGSAAEDYVRQFGSKYHLILQFAE